MESSDKIFKSVKEVIDQLVLAGKHVWIIGPLPEASGKVPRLLYLQSLGFERDKELRVRKNLFLQKRFNALQKLKLLSSNPKVSLILPHETLCAVNDYCDIERNGYPLYFDDNHLTTAGAKIVAKALEPIFYP